MYRLCTFVVIACFLLFGCGGGSPSQEKKEGSEKSLLVQAEDSKQSGLIALSGRLSLFSFEKPGQTNAFLPNYAASDWANATVEVLDAWGNILGFASADTNGNFSLTVPPGKNYFLRAISGNLVLKAIIEDLSIDVHGVVVSPNTTAVVQVLGVLLENPNIASPGVDISGALAGINVTDTVSQIILDASLGGLVSALEQDISRNYNPNGISATVGAAGNAGTAIAGGIVNNITAPDDLTAPAVFSVIPAGGSLGVNIFQDIAITFSEAMAADTFSPGGFRVTAGGVNVTGTVSVYGRNLKFSPSAPLFPDTVYIATVSGTVADLSGNSLGADYSWSFTTGSNAEPFQAVQVAAGTGHTLLLKSNGTLWAWGRDFSGVQNGGMNNFRPVPVQILGEETATGTYWKKISVRGYHNFGIKSDGTLWGWGANDFGQLGDGSYTEREFPVEIGGGNWRDIFAGRYHVMGIKEDGTLWSWGVNSSGQFGNGKTTGANIPTQVGTDSDWQQVALGSSHSIALKTDGSLWSWGSGEGVGHSEGGQARPVQLGLSKDWLKVAASGAFSVALKMDGSLWSWGRNDDGQLGHGSTQSSLVPVRVGQENDWKDIWAGGDWWDSQNRTGAVKSDGSLWAWGANSFGQLGNGNTSKSKVPVRIGTGSEWSLVAAGDTHSVGIKSDQTVWTWGNNKYSALGDGTAPLKTEPVSVGSETNWNRVEAGWGYTLATKIDQTLWGWGENGKGQLGLGTSENEKDPGPVQAGTAWAQTGSGASHTLSIRTDGTLWSWGSNIFGQLGNGTYTSSTTPVQVGFDTGWLKTSSGGNFSVALKKDGTLWTWGNNNNGQLGDGSGVVDRNNPLQFGNGVWSEISSGDFHVAAIRGDGTLWSWGSNEFGQLGDGTETDRKFPVQVGTGNQWIDVAAGDDYTMAIKANGTLWAWGDNVFGQLGDGTNLSRKSPVQVGTALNWKRISSGGTHSLGLRGDGTLWSWGNNDYGQLGDGTYVDRSTPVAVGVESDWEFISGGRYHSAGVKTGGTLWSWGGNEYGQIGDGTAWRTTPRPLPAF
ncbi:MAG: Ig-like domain-containing protein [Nitrospinota bacterium]